MSFELECFGDSGGSLHLGWIEQGVFYARFVGRIDPGLATRFAERFTALIGDSVGVRYFADSSELSSYDCSAAAAPLAAVLAKRDQFKLVVARTWQGPVGPRGQAFAAALGCIEFVTTAEAFEARLRAAAPRAAAKICQLRSVPPVRPLPADAAVRERAPEALERGKGEPSGRGETYAYVFDLTDFEGGRFTATRFSYLSARPRAGWLCLARDDEHALELARRAALVEWAPPAERRPEDFSVRFVRSGGLREPWFDRRR
jgi:hypothetical protein